MPHLINSHKKQNGRRFRVVVNDRMTGKMVESYSEIDEFHMVTIKYKIRY